MKTTDTARSALEAIRGHRMRSILTMIGILIGIAAVTITVGIGQGAQAQVASQINKLGSNLLIVTPGSTTSSTGFRGGRGSATTLSQSDASTLANPAVAPDIAAVTAVASASEVVQTTAQNWTTTVNGTSPNWLTTRDRTVTQGRFITATDIATDNPVVVIGQDTSSELFGTASPIGQSVQIAGSTYTVVGLLNSSGSSSASSTSDDDMAIMPSSTYATRVAAPASRASVSTIYVQAKSGADLSAAYQETQNALATNHNVTLASADFTVTSQQSLVATATSTNKTLTVMLGGIAAISLLVGGIGVMNIMLVSVTERTKEIGLRKSLGATPRAIRSQFLTEASTLGLAGGALGLGLGVGAAYFLPKMLNQPVSISPLVAGGSLAVSLAIGVAAGVYPAARAAKLAPIDALRTP
jgi:putative ABC transport system permease protein